MNTSISQETETGQVCTYIAARKGRPVIKWCFVDSLEVGFNTGRIVKCRAMGIDRTPAAAWNNYQQDN